MVGRLKKSGVSNPKNIRLHSNQGSRVEIEISAKGMAASASSRKKKLTLSILRIEFCQKPIRNIGRRKVEKDGLISQADYPVEKL